MRNSCTNGLLFLGVVFLLGIGLEVTLRIYHSYIKLRSSYQHAPSKEMVFIRKPNAYPEINSQGFRDNEHSQNNPKNSYRLLVIGDSVTNGFGVKMNEMYTSRLRQFLKKEDSRYEIINFGMNQYSTVQEIALLEEFGLKMSPDFVIISYVLNDPTPDGSINDFFQRDKSVSLAADWLAKKYSGLRARTSQDVEIDGCDYFDYYSKMHCSAVKWQAVRKSLSRLSELADQHNFRVLLVVFPLLSDQEEDTFDRYPWRNIHQRVLSEAAFHDIDTLDLLPHFAKQSPSEFKITPTDLLHPNGLGHELAAKAIYQKLVQIGIKADEM